MYTRPRRWAGALLPALATALLACGGGDADSPAREGAEAAAPVAAPARRIVSLVPAHTDALVALGAADRLVARTRWDDHPELAHLPSLEDALTPSVEWLLAQDPDLVIAWQDVQARTVVARLRALGVPVYSSGVETLADVRAALHELGALTGLEAEAAALVGSLDAVLDSVRSAAAGRPSLRVVYLIGLEPATVAGPGTFIHELLEAAGAENVFGDVSQPWPQVGVEAVLARSPDLVVVSAGSDTDEALARLRGLPGWSNLPAVRDGRAYYVDGAVANRPGPYAIQTARILADVVARAAVGAPR